MFLSGVLFALFLTFILGAIAWTIARKWYKSRPAPVAMPSAAAAADALARHPASRARRGGERGRTPIGPDDDPEFLRQLAERIRGER